LKVLTTFALDLEFAPWRRLHRFAKVSSGEFATYAGSFADAEVRVALTGIGSVRAKKVVGVAMGWRPDVCIAAGLAGSLRGEHRVGRILAPRDIMELESGRTVAADARLIERAEACGAVAVDRLLTSLEVISSAEGKKRLGHMAAAVDMESFAVAAEAAAEHVAVIAIRAISDDADEDLPMDFGGVMNGSGNVNTAKVVRALARAPHKLPALMRLGRNSRAASMKLAGFLERYVTGMTAAAFSRDAEIVEARRA
jgi:adenosylhomocysteine nucleosidase